MLRLATVLCVLSAVLRPLTAQPPRRDSIVVTGAYTAAPLEESDRSVSVFYLPDLRPVMQTPADILRMDPALDLRARAPNLVQSDLSIRGAGFGQTLVLLDGLRLNDAQSGHHNLDVPVPAGALERIEILKGSGSTLYGSDAVGGVVNLITRPAREPEFRMSAAAGNYGMNQQQITLGGGAGRFGERLSVSRDFSTGFIANRDYRNLSLSSQTSIDTALGSTQVTLAHNDRPFGAEQFYGNYNSWERTRGWFASIRQPLGTRTFANFAYRRHTDLFVLYRDRPAVFTNRHEVESWQAVLRRSDEVRPTVRLHYGGEAYGDQVRSTNLGAHERARGAVYGAMDVRALRRFSFNAGLRDEMYGSANHEFSPSFSGAVWLGSGFKLRASASRAFRLPTYTDLYYHDPANIGSPNLRPEEAWSYETGGEWQGASRWRASAVWFDRHEKNGIDYVRASVNEIWRATNFQSLRFTGMETTVESRLAARHTLGLSYMYLHGASEAVGNRMSKYVFNYPVHTGLVNWNWSAGPWIARFRMGALERLGRDPYAVADVYTAARFSSWEPFVYLTNLTATRYQEIAGVAMPGRAIVIGLSLVSMPYFK